MGLEKQDRGEFEIGETVKVAYVDQNHKDLSPEKTVYEVISQGVESFRMGGRDMNARAYLSKFNFTGADQEKKIGVLSGGERNRLHLAMAERGGQRASARRTDQRHRRKHAPRP